MTAGPVLQTTTEQAVEIGAQLLGLSALAGTLAAVVALGYRWAARERVSAALTLLVGLSGVALYLNTTTALGRAIGGDMVAAELEVALFNIGAFLAGGVGAAVGGRAGDRFGTDVLLDGGASDVDEEVGRLVKTVGRVVTVTIPEEIDDVVGYDPVPAATKEKLAGRTFVFPRNLTVEELRERLVSRLKADYGVGTVDLELGGDGSVEYLAVGSRAAGIGPSLPPATTAVAIRADPAFSASAGDVVQVWETDPMRRVLTAELRGVADDVVTIAIDAADTPKLDPRRRYRLVTLPVEDRPEREFASLLRAADETFSTVTVAAGSPLDGILVGALDLTVVAVTPEGQGTAPVALPEDDQILSPGDTVFAIARPETLRRLETAGEAIDSALIGAADRRPTAGEESDDDTPAAESATSGEEPGDPSAVDAEGESRDEIDGPVESQPGEGSPGADGTDGIAGQAGANSFEELKSAFESDETGWDDGAEGGEPIEAAASGGGDGDATEFEEGGSSFDELKSEFESGDADWADDGGDQPGDADDPMEPDEADDEPPVDADDPTDPGEADDVVALDEADISFDEDSDAEATGDGDLDPLDVDDEDEVELIDLDDSDSDDDSGFDDDLSLDDDSGFDDDLDEFGDGADDGSERTDEGDGEGADDGSDDDDDGDGGGSKSFAELKEEFESGEADWEDDIDDSPGGDMRLDE